MARFVAVCRWEEVVEGQGKAIDVEGLPVALFRVGDRPFALWGRCPHAGGLLGLGWVEEGEVVCPLHRWGFKLQSGRCSTVRGESVHVFRCEVRDGDVWVEL